MSADNWGTCPKCLDKEEREHNEVIESLPNKYGKIPAHKYEELLLKSKEPIAGNRTLREDYEIYTDDCGMFSVTYHCQCSVCGFKFSFSHEENAMESE